MIWDEAAALALRQPGAASATSYGQPAVRVNGHVVLNTGREADTSFCLHVEPELKRMLIDAYPETFWETPHYAGWPAVLVRHAGPDEALVRDLVVQTCADAAARRAARKRT